ncbi:MAG: FecR domain-containing protein [Lacibacter sp.]
MSMNQDRLQDLLAKNAGRKCSREELEELYHLISEAKLSLVEPLLDEQFKNIEENLHKIDVDWEFMLQEIVRHRQESGPGKIIRNMWWKRIAVAAAVLLLVSFGVYYLQQEQKIETDKVNISKVVPDIKAPDLSKAVIKLANGEQVTIDSAIKDGLVLNGNMKLVKLPSGEISYVIEGPTDEAVVYNTVSNPRGSKVVSMQLSDGTIFWLNAGSSIKYPVVFSGADRKVEITGEVYFEVAHNEAKPFIVRKGETEIKVLGTHFNVNAYDEKEEMEITLLEGSVQVQNNGNTLLLRPGQQAAIQHTIKIVDGIDINLVMAWKNGLFAFKGATLQEVMREIARWYDLKVVYEGPVPERLFTGKIRRSYNLSDVLKILGENSINYEVRGKEIVIRK